MYKNSQNPYGDALQRRTYSRHPNGIILYESYRSGGSLVSQAKVPALIKPIRIPSFPFTEMAPLFDNLPAAKKDRNIRTMEEYNQGFGSILYLHIEIVFLWMARIIDFISS